MFFVLKPDFTHAWGSTSSILEDRGPEMHSSGTRPVTFFLAQSSLGGTYFLLGGAHFLLGGARPLNAPRGAGPAFLPPQKRLFRWIAIEHRWAVPRYFLGTGTVGTFVVPVPIPRYFAIFWRYRYFSFIFFFSRDFTNVIKNLKRKNAFE